MSEKREGNLPKEKRLTLEEIASGKLPEIDKIADEIKNGKIPRDEIVPSLEQGLLKFNDYFEKREEYLSDQDVSKYLEYFEKRKECLTLDKYFDEYFNSGKYLSSKWRVYSLDQLYSQAQLALKAIQNQEPIQFWNITIKKRWELVNNRDMKELYGNGEIIFCDDIKEDGNKGYLVFRDGMKIAWLSKTFSNIEEKVEHGRRNKSLRSDIKQRVKKRWDFSEEDNILNGNTEYLICDKVEEVGSYYWISRKGKRIALLDMDKHDIWTASDYAKRASATLNQPKEYHQEN